MQEIKFKAWVLSERKMYDVFAIDFRCSAVSVMTPGSPFGYTIPMRDVFLLQFTGERDKVKDEIYVDDVLKTEDPLTDEFGLIIVDFKDGQFIGKTSWTNYQEYAPLNVWTNDVFVGMIRKIGNIYEDPKLQRLQGAKFK